MRDDWIETTLGEICKDGLFTDGDWVESKDQDPEGDYRLLQLADIGDGAFLDKSDRWMNKEQFQRLGCTKLEVNDVLIARMPDPIGRACLLPEGLPSSATVVDVAIVRTGHEILQRILSLIVNSPEFRNEAFSLLTGTTRQRISRGNLSKISFWLPPLPEQKRIVDLISSVDSYIEALQQQLESAKNSKSAYVNTIVSEIFDRGKKTKIADIAEVKGGKRLPKGTPWSEEPTDHRYIRATDIKDGIVLTENLVYVPDDVWPLISRYVVNQGDVVITIAGTIGQVGVIPTSLDGVNLTENAARIVVNKELVRSNYLSMLLGSNYYQQDIDSKTKKTTQPKLGLNMINSIEIPLPDLAEQDEIFSVVSQIDTLIARTNNLILQTIALRTGLLSDLLSGEHEIPTSYDKVMGAA